MSVTADGGARTERAMAGSANVPPSEPPGGDPAGGSKSKERKEFAALYRQWHPIVWSAARAQLHNDFDADGATQRVFLRLLKAGPSAWEPRDPERFFRRAGQNEARSAQRRSRRQQGITDTILLSLGSPHPSPDDDAARIEFLHALEVAVAKLPPRCSTVMLLFLFENLTQTEIAQSLEITVSAVEHQVARGRRKLQQDLSQFRRPPTS